MNKIALVHFCYFQNTFPFVSTSRKTGNIDKESKNVFMEQGIVNAELQTIQLNSQQHM